MSTTAPPLDAIARWDVPHAAAAVLAGGEVVATHGDTARQYRIASVGKLVAALATLVAVEEGTVALDDPAGPPGATLRHLLAHAAGYGFESDAGALAAPGVRRIYSNRGIEVAAAHVAEASGMPFAEYQREAVLEPLGMHDSELRGSPADALHSTVGDLAAFAAELRRPTLVAPSSAAAMFAVQFPGLDGVLPGVGRYTPLDWGLGVERNFARPGHWAGTRVSPSTGGHFGGAGTFLWFDREHDVACVCLTDRRFGPWAMHVWPPLCDAVIDAYGRR